MFPIYALINTKIKQYTSFYVLNILYLINWVINCKFLWAAAKTFPIVARTQWNNRTILAWLFENRDSSSSYYVSKQTVTMSQCNKRNDCILFEIVRLFREFWRIEFDHDSVQRNWSHYRHRAQDCACRGTINRWHVCFGAVGVTMSAEACITGM